MPPFAGRVTQAVSSWSCARLWSQLGNALASGSRYAGVNGFVHPAQPGAGSDRPPAASGRTAFSLGPCPVNLESFVECTDVRWTESASECKRRIRLRHVATGSDLVAILVRVSSRLRLPVA